MKYYIVTVLCMSFLNLFAQPSWQRSEEIEEINLALFHSTQTANFPTTESLKRGNFMYEISHRFLPSIKDGYDVLYGFDGPARIRFAIGYGITDQLMVMLGRSNELDNIDLYLKQEIFQINSKILPSVFSLRGGIAWNTEVPANINRSKGDGDNFQYYLQLIYNTMLLENKLGIGLVPSYLYNSFIYAIDKQYTFTLGTYVQYYINSMWSIWIEHNAIITGYRGKIRLDESGPSYNSIAFGFDIETGGHIFHLMVTNNARLNTSHFLVGADRSAGDDMWRLGFGIIRFF